MTKFALWCASRAGCITHTHRRSTTVFHWDNGLMLTKAGLAVDFRRRQPRAFISHAHSDHIARHEYALCTPETAALYQHRLGRVRPCRCPIAQPIEWGGLRLTTFPAGHCLGSAMLLAEDGEQSLLVHRRFQTGRVGHGRARRNCPMPTSW